MLSAYFAEDERNMFFRNVCWILADCTVDVISSETAYIVYTLVFLKPDSNNELWPTC
jgi:hypothetical protein